MKQVVAITELLLLLFLCFPNCSHAQPGVITGQRIYGGAQNEYTNDVLQTGDGGYIMAGSTTTYGAGGDAYLVKTDALGNPEWLKAFGGISSDEFNSVLQTGDGGFLAVGETWSFGAGSMDIFAIRTDSTGDTVWTRTYGGISYEFGYSVAQTYDGGFAIAGATISFGAGAYDAYLIRIDPNGDTLWTRTYGSVQTEIARDVQENADSGFVITGEIANPLTGICDVLLIRTDANGDTLWTRAYGGPDQDRGSAVRQTTDGGFIVTGETQSFGIGNYYDMYAIRTDANGDTIWTKTFGGVNEEFGYDVALTPGDGFTFSGITKSYGSGNADAFLIRTDLVGNVLWTGTYGTTGQDRGNAVQMTADGGYVIGGESKLLGLGKFDLYLIKTDAYGYASCNYTNPVFSTSKVNTFQVPTGITVGSGVISNPVTGLLESWAGSTLSLCDFEPTPAPVITPSFQRTIGGTSDEFCNSVSLTVYGDYVLAGQTFSFGAGGNDVFLCCVDKTGNLRWSNAIGGNMDEYGYDVKGTPDGGFVVVGETQSFGAGISDVYLVRTDASGNVIWSKTYGGTGSDIGQSVSPTSDGGYLVTGSTGSYGAGGDDIYLIKTNALGDTVWTRTYGGASTDRGVAGKQTADGGYIVAGYTYGFGAGSSDFLLIKTDANGDTAWVKSYGGTGLDMCRAVEQTADGGYLLGGITSSFGSGSNDAYLIRTDSLGNLLWSKTYGGAESDDIRALTLTSDKGSAITGRTGFGPGTGSEYLLRLDSIGDTLWTRTYGGNSFDMALSVIQTADSGFAVGGRVQSFGVGGNDMYLVKTDPLGNSGACHQSGTATLITNAATSVGSALLTALSGAMVSDSVPSTEEPATQIIDPVISLELLISDASCNGNSDGSIDMTVSGGDYPYTYSWSSTDSTEDITGASAGTYWVTVSGSAGCTVSDTLAISEPAILTTAISKTDVNCYGGNDGTATVVPAGGTAPYSYFWSMGQIFPTAVGLYPGTYTVNVVDANGCPATNIISVAQPNPLTAILSGTDVTCNGGNDGTASVTASSGTPPYAYLWDDPGTGTTQAIISLSAGTYTVVITDSCGAVIMDSVTVSEPAALTATIAATDVSCNGYADGAANLTAVNGTQPYGYLWSTSDTVEDLSGLTVGVYSVSVTDACASMVYDSVSIAQPAVLTTSMTHSDVSCYGFGDGAATVTPSGGTAPYSYLWNTGQATSTAIALFPGAYGVNVFDANSCLSSNSVTITQPDMMTAQLSALDASCYGGSNGIITLTKSGGTSPYSYLWSNGDTIQDLSGVTAGVYAVTLTDACGAMIVDSASVDQPEAPAVVISGTDITCNGNNDGSASATVTGGVAPYSYLWSTGAVTQMIAGLTDTTYTVSVTDACGIAVYDTVAIVEPDVLTTTIAKTDVTCNGGGNGSATVLASGGTNPYNYLWNVGQTNATAIGLFPGNYSVNVTDAKGCLASNLVTITEPLPLNLSFSVTDATCNSADGTVSVIVSGGVNPYSYAWSSGGTAATDTALTGGNYSVIITDNNGCMDSSAVTIPVLAPVQEICMVTVDSTSSKNVVVWEKPVASNIDSFRIYRDIIGVYTWVGSVPYANESYFTDSTNGVNPKVTSYRYKVSTLDACGNESELSDYHETIHVQTSKNGGVVDLLWDNYEGFGFGFYRILRDSTGSGAWEALDSVTGNNFTYTDIAPPTVSTAYAIEVVHPAGCTADKTKNWNSSKSNTSSVGAAPAALSAATSSTSASQGACNGTATVTVSGGTLPYTYLWNGNAGFQTAATATGLCAGNYFVTVTDAFGDTLIAQVTVSETSGTALSATTSVIDAEPGVCDGTATVTASGGTGPYSYQWDGNALNQTTQTATVLCSGTYSVEVTDSLGNQTVVFATVGTVPGILALHDGQDGLQAFPNPYSDKTTISFTLYKEAWIYLTVYNMLGERVATLASGYQKAGKQVFSFGAVEYGYGGGVYFIRLQAGNVTTVKRLVEVN